ncbi:hypothetical protein Gotur_032636 [Gossypium turneri]
MVDLHNVGTFNVDTGFKTGYLNELEKMLEKALLNAMLKARPNIESRIRLLKRDWSIVHDNFGFGWDEHRQLVVAEDAVWDSYLNSHKEAGQFRHRSFPYYDQLTTIYARDRATGKDAQTVADVIEEINVQDVHTVDINEERNEFYDCEADVSLDEMDVSATEPQTDKNQGGVPESNASSQASRGTKRKWVPEEDAALVSCMVDLHNVGTLMLIPGSKPAKPNIESRIRLLKREWSIVYDMLNGQNNSDFGWDEHRQLVVAEDDQLTAIYARDRATGKDAQTAADVLEEINDEGLPTTDMNEERNSFYDCEADVSLDDMDVSATEPRRDRDQRSSSSSNKKKKKSDARDNILPSDVRLEWVIRFLSDH